MDNRVKIASHAQGRGGYRYELLEEIAERYGLTNAQASETIQETLRQLREIDGDGIILDQQPIRPQLLESNPSDLDVDYWLFVSQATADEIREAIAASSEAGLV